MGKYLKSVGKNSLDFLKYVGPGLLVTVGFIDPGNWASNIAAGSGYGYSLLWMVTLSTVMLIILQHNAAHLGIVTGLCISEAASRYMNKTVKNIVLWTAVAAAVATAMAEILGGAIALDHGRTIRFFHPCRKCDQSGFRCFTVRGHSLDFLRLRGIIFGFCRSSDHITLSECISLPERYSNHNAWFYGRFQFFRNAVLKIPVNFLMRNVNDHICIDHPFTLSDLLPGSPGSVHAHPWDISYP